MAAKTTPRRRTLTHTKAWLHIGDRFARSPGTLLKRGGAHGGLCFEIQRLENHGRIGIELCHRMQQELWEWFGFGQDPSGEWKRRFGYWWSLLTPEARGERQLACAFLAHFAATHEPCPQPMQPAPNGYFFDPECT